MKSILCQRCCWYFRATYDLPVMWKLFQVPSLFVDYQRLGNRNKLLTVIYITSNVLHIWGILLNIDLKFYKKRVDFSSVGIGVVSSFK
jgi:hypothetical protein